jgi:hypothetical protein
MIAVPTVLVAFNWQAKSNSHQRIARFVDYLFSRIDRLQAPGFDLKWKSINLAATVPGLTRFSAAQDGSNVWRICHIRSRRRLARRRAATTGWSATPPRRWIIPARMEGEGELDRRPPSKLRVWSEPL